MKTFIGLVLIVMVSAANAQRVFTIQGCQYGEREIVSAHSNFCKSYVSVNDALMPREDCTAHLVEGRVIQNNSTNLLIRDKNGFALIRMKSACDYSVGEKVAIAAAHNKRVEYVTPDGMTRVINDYEQVDSRISRPTLDQFLRAMNDPEIRANYFTSDYSATNFPGNTIVSRGPGSLTGGGFRGPRRWPER